MVSVGVVSSVQTYKYENECCQKLEYTGVPVAVHRFTDQPFFQKNQSTTNYHRHGGVPKRTRIATLSRAKK